MRPARRLLLLATLAALPSCANGSRSSSLALSSLSPAEALAVLQLRARSRDTTATSGTMTLTSSTGERVTLDFAARTRPGFLRLRAWRFGEAVLDVTTTPDGAWLYVPPIEKAGGSEDTGQAAGMPDLPDPDDLARAWTLISGGVLAYAAITEQEADSLTLRSDLDGAPVRVRIDRAHLRPVEYQFPDAPDTSIRLEPNDWLDAGTDAAMDSPTWPRVVTLLSPRGVIEIHFERAEVNVDQPDGVFDPPARAKPVGAEKGA